LRSPPLGPDAPETAFVLGITRQESSFNPLARSGAGARGMMQLMPATARSVARRLGLAYSSGALDNPDYNMKLGSAYLGQLVDQYSGSYVMAAAAYNAGPGRPTTWSSACGDPRGSAMDPLDFIECIPFSETRDYVMRVMEATQVYRARLHGGVAPLTLQDDLKRGAFGYH
jgi:soluble lytic murein transglycosylase